MCVKFSSSRTAGDLWPGYSEKEKAFENSHTKEIYEFLASLIRDRPFVHTRVEKDDIRKKVTEKFPTLSGKDYTRLLESIVQSIFSLL